MQITFHSDRCQGHNRCTLLAPELFESDDEGFAVPLIHGDVPAALMAKAQLAADNCPEYAIEISDPPEV